MMIRDDASTYADPASDPFGERIPPAVCMSRHVLGGRFRFESDSAELLSLVEAAYGRLPAHRFPHLSPEFRIELRVVRRGDVATVAEPPAVHMQSGMGLFGGVVDAWNYVLLSPAQRRGLIVVSEDRLRFPYHVRYELIEFAVFLLAARVQNLVPLHGACVGTEGHGVLLLGASGAGKSTLSLQALLDGMDFLAEDGVFVHPESLLATGAANFLHVKQDALRFVDDPATRQWIETSPTIRRRSGVVKHEAALREGPGRAAATPLRLAAAVIVSPQPADDPHRLLMPLPWERVAWTLAADQPYAAGQPGWDRFVQRVARLGVYELRRGAHPRDAVAALRRLVDKAGKVESGRA